VLPCCDNAHASAAVEEGLGGGNSWLFYTFLSLPGKTACLLVLDVLVSLLPAPRSRATRALRKQRKEIGIHGWPSKNLASECSVTSPASVGSQSALLGLIRPILLIFLPTRPLAFFLSSRRPIVLSARCLGCKSNPGNPKLSEWQHLETRGPFSTPTTTSVPALTHRGLLTTTTTTPHPADRARRCVPTAPS
jgi:hypothetical protein